MSRVQLALNVTDLDQAVEFYSKLFATEPAKRKPGYANFAIADPPLKLVLFEGPEGATLNHLGVETDNAGDVEAAEARLSGTGLETTGIDDTICCYATKVETWVTDPDGAKWEWYVKTGDSDQLTNEIVGEDSSAMCCAPPRPNLSPSGDPPQPPNPAAVERRLMGVPGGAPRWAPPTREDLGPWVCHHLSAMMQAWRIPLTDLLARPRPGPLQ